MSQYDIEGKIAPPSKAKVAVFIDESKPQPDVLWHYVSIVSLPLTRVEYALSLLEQDRISASYDREIKWLNVRRKKARKPPGAIEDVATRWLNRITCDHDLWRFGVVGIDYSRLCQSAFGERPGEITAHVQRRFLASLLKYHLKYCYAEFDAVEVKYVYHDREGRLESDDYYCWLPLIKASGDNITFSCDSISFIDSDHNADHGNRKASHFIQLADIIAGATRFVYDYPQADAGRRAATNEFRCLLERIGDSKRSENPRSRYGHRNRAHIRFFPENALSAEELDDPITRSLSGFYQDRPMAASSAFSGQHSLDF